MINTYKSQLDEINVTISTILEDILTANTIILEGLQKCDAELLASAKERLTNMSSKTAEVDNEIVKILALHSPEAKDLRFIVSTFKITNELVRASSNTRSFIKGFASYCGEVDLNIIKEYALPLQKATIECLQGILDMSTTTCVDETRELFNKVLIAESKTDDLYELLQDSIFEQAKEIDDFHKFTKILNALRKSEKIADRALEIANLMLFARQGGHIGSVE
jgi:phosphate transport system protein